MDRDERSKKVLEDDDYIHSPKFGNSLNKFIQKNSEGVEDETIAKILLMDVEEVEKIYQEAVLKLRENMEQE